MAKKTHESSIITTEKIDKSNKTVRTVKVAIMGIAFLSESVVAGSHVFQALTRNIDGRIHPDLPLLVAGSGASVGAALIAYGIHKINQLFDPIYQAQRQEKSQNKQNISSDDEVANAVVLMEETRHGSAARRNNANRN